MKYVGALAVLAGVGLAGFQSTLEGAKQDTANNAAAVSSAAASGAAATKRAAANAGRNIHAAAVDTAGATVVSPEVKTAFIRDPILNDPSNTINVTTRDGIVHIQGHVKTAKMKERATEDAQAVLDKHHRTDKIENELTVKP